MPTRTSIGASQRPHPATEYRGLEAPASRQAGAVTTPRRPRATYRRATTHPNPTSASRRDASVGHLCTPAEGPATGQAARLVAPLNAAHGAVHGGLQGAQARSGIVLRLGPAAYRRREEDPGGGSPAAR